MIQKAELVMRGGNGPAGDYEATSPGEAFVAIAEFYGDHEFAQNIRETLLNPNWHGRIYLFPDREKVRILQERRVTPEERATKLKGCLRPTKGKAGWALVWTVMLAGTALMATGVGQDDGLIAKAGLITVGAGITGQTIMMAYQVGRRLFWNGQMRRKRE